MEDLSIIIPSYNEDHSTIEAIKSSLQSMGAEVIVVDDGSDNPFPSAIKHKKNLGYGSALMTGISFATRNLIMTIDGDGQHSADEALRLYTAFKLMPDPDMVIGVRRLKKESLHRFLGRKALNWTASFICNHWIPDLNSGARIFKKSISVGYFPILCKTFSFTTSLTISMMADQYNVEFFPIKVHDRKFGKSRVKLIKDGLVTLKYILWIGLALRTRRLRAWLNQR